MTHQELRHQLEKMDFEPQTVEMLKLLLVDGLSQHAVATRCGVTQSYISRVKRRFVGGQGAFESKAELQASIREWVSIGTQWEAGFRALPSEMVSAYMAWPSAVAATASAVSKAMAVELMAERTALNGRVIYENRRPITGTTLTEAQIEGEI